MATDRRSWRVRRTRTRPARTVLAALLAVLALTACAESSRPAAGAATSDPTTPAVPMASQPVAADPTAAPDNAGAAAAPSSRAPRKPSAVPGSPVPRATNAAARLRTLPATTSQVIVVHGSGYATTHVSVEAFARVGGRWTAALPPMAGRIGGRGFNDAKREGDRTTPTGVYTIDATMYGIAPDPGVKYRYHRLVPDDWWNENSDSPGYNTFHHGPNPGGPSEPLWQISPQYTHLAVIRYNMPATPGLGSGIFLHQATGNATLGCVSVGAGDLVRLLTWLDPAASPRIVMAPTERLDRY